MYIDFFPTMEAIHTHKTNMEKILHNLSIFPSKYPHQIETLTQLPKGSEEYFQYIPPTILNFIVHKTNWTMKKIILPGFPNIPKVTLFFVYDKHTISPETFSQYIVLIKSWFIFLSQHIHTQKQLKCFLYLTPFNKKTPFLKDEPLSEMNINTGYHFVGTEYIYIYRHEEWFKVFLHETIHAFNLDTNPLQQNDPNTCQKYLSKIQKQQLCKENMTYKHYEGIAEWLAIMFYVIYHVILSNPSPDIQTVMKKELIHAKSFITHNKDIRLYEYALERIIRLEKLLHVEANHINKPTQSLKATALVNKLF